jgi:hypothetical protein
MRHVDDPFSKPLSDNERRFLQDAMLFGATGYPVRKIGRHWHWEAFHGIKGTPTVYGTRHEAREAVRCYVETLVEREQRSRDERP